MTACFGGRQLVYMDLKKTQAALCFGVCIVFADVFKKGGNDGSAGSLAGFHHHQWDEMRVREEVTVRGPQVVGGQACTDPSGPALDQPAPVGWRPGELGDWTRRGHWVEGTNPSVKTWRDKPPGGGDGSTLRNSQVVALLPAAQPRPLTGGGRDPFPGLGILCWTSSHAEN